MSGGYNVNDRYGHSQQQHKRTRDEGDHDPRGPRPRDLRNDIARDVQRHQVQHSAAPPSAVVRSAPSVVNAVMVARGVAAVEWEILNGLLVKDEDMRLLHIPVSLRPMPFPRSVFSTIWDLQALLQQLYVAVSQDHEFLRQALAPVLVDDFTSKLWGIYCRVRERVGASKTILAVTRSDYMMSRAPVGRPVVADVKQIEFNSLSVGGLPWTSKLVSMHSYITNRYPHASDGPSPVQPQPSQALAEVAQALSMGVLSYCRTHSIDPSVACVLHIQGHPKYAHNITDQEGVEVAAITGNRLNWVKKTFGDLAYEKIKLEDNGRLKIMSPLGQLEVAVVYYRCGWSPDDYRKPEMYSARETLELSAAIKCPGIAFHLTGLKKMQESLAQPGALEKFVGAADAERLKNVFEEMHPAADAAPGVLERVRARPHDWVLKPQREGGGNNKFGDEVAKAVLDWPVSKLQEYVLMRRIDCPAVPTFCVRKSQTSAVDAVSEVGIYGVYFACDGEVAFNKAAGYVVRSKEAHVNEAGILHGGGFVDSLRLVDDAVWSAQVVGSSSPLPLRPSSSSSSSASLAINAPLPSSSSSTPVAVVAPASAALPRSTSWTLAAESVAVSEAARSFALVAARGIFHSDVSVMCEQWPMLPSASGTLFASLLSVFTSLKRGPTVEGVWWAPLVHSCSIIGGKLVFEDHVLQTLHALVLDKLNLHFEVNDVWKGKQSAQECVRVKRCLRALQQLRIVDEISGLTELKHNNADEWERVQIKVKQQAAVNLSSLSSSILISFHRALVGQTPPSAATGAQCHAELRDNGLWSICLEGCSAPVIEIHDSRLQRMWAAFCACCSSLPSSVNFFEAVYACVLRYESTMHCVSGRYGHHFGIPSSKLPSIAQAVAASRSGSCTISDWIDCFATPMTIMELAANDSAASRTRSRVPSHSFVRYCSPYLDTDACFGSFGSFFDADLRRIVGSGDVLFLHPPNDYFFMERLTNVLKDMFINPQNNFSGVCVFPSTKPLLKMQDPLQSVCAWQPVAHPVFCSGHSRDDVAVTRASDCAYRVGSMSRFADMQVVLKPLLLSLMASFDSAAASIVPPYITQKNCSQYLTKLECDKGQGMLQSALRDSAIQSKYSSIARGYVEQDHITFCCPASIITIINATRPGGRKLSVKDFFTDATEAILPKEVIACSGTTLEYLPALMRAHGLIDCSITLASSCTPSEFRVAAMSSLKHPSSFIIVNFSRRALNQNGWGHFSPLAAYDVASDSFLVMDVEAASGTNCKFWVRCDVLHAAMVGTIADGSSRSRGWIKASAP